MACSSNCNCADCAPDVKPGQRGPQGDPGPATEISASVTMLPADAAATAEVTGIPPVQHIAFGIPAVPGPAGADGADGTDALPLYTTLLSSFIQPGLDSSVNGVEIGDATPASLGMWVWIRGGGYYRVVNIAGNVLQLANPGTNGISTGVGWPTGVPGQTPVGSPVQPTVGPMAETQVVLGVGVPGLPGVQGPQGDPSPEVDFIIATTTTIPVAAPVAGAELVMYVDNLVTPTIVALYAWDGSAWNASPNLLGQGTIWQTSNGDPNSTLPSGPIGTFVLRTDVMSIYQRTSVSVWTLLGSLTPTFDQVWTQSSGQTTRPVYYDPDIVVHSVGGPLVIDLERVLTVVDVQAAIELDYTALSEYSEWWLELENTTGGALAVTYAAGKWEKNTGVTEVSSLAASGSPGDRVVLHFIASKGSLLVTEFLTPVGI